MTKTISTYLCAFVLLLFIQSCNIFSDNGPGTGTINVTLNNKYYDVTEVTGKEWLSYYCYGKLLDKSLSIGIGTHPSQGDTLDYQKFNSVNDIYLSFGNYRTLEGSGNIIILERKGNQIKGKFRFIAVSENDTLDFSDGNFNVEFRPVD